jgi:hypothetical protein
MRKRELISIVESALIYKMNDGGDTPVIDCLLEDVRQTLKRDPRFSRVTYREFNVLFAALTDAARRLLGGYESIEWDCATRHIDWEYVARMVTEAVVDEMSKEFESDGGGVP